MNILYKCLSWYSFNYLFQYYFPNEYRQLRTILTNAINYILKEGEPILIKLFVNVIYIYSYTEIRFKKYVSPFIEKYSASNNKDFISLITYYDFNFNSCHEIYTNSSIQWLRGIISINPVSEYNYHIIKNNITKQLLFEIRQDISNENIDFKPFNNHFLSINLILSNLDPINIVLKTDKYDFYVVGNKIDKTFINHYLKNIIHIDIDIANYCLEVIDNNVNMFTLTNDKFIILENNNYTIKKNDSILTNMPFDKSESKDTLSEKGSSSDNDFIKVE